MASVTAGGRWQVEGDELSPGKLLERETARIWDNVIKDSSCLRIVWPHQTKHRESDLKTRAWSFPGNAESLSVHLTTTKERRRFCFIYIQRHIPVEPAEQPLRLSALVHYGHMEVGGRWTNMGMLIFRGILKLHAGETGPKKRLKQD